jgi:hypothetical protein
MGKGERSNGRPKTSVLFVLAGRAHITDANNKITAVANGKIV